MSGWTYLKVNFLSMKEWVSIPNKGECPVGLVVSALYDCIENNVSIPNKGERPVGHAYSTSVKVFWNYVSIPNKGERPVGRVI